jgi:hypothetical protein
MAMGARRSGGRDKVRRAGPSFPFELSKDGPRKLQTHPKTTTRCLTSVPGQIPRVFRCDIDKDDDDMQVRGGIRLTIS